MPLNSTQEEHKSSKLLRLAVIVFLFILGIVLYNKFYGFSPTMQKKIDVTRAGSYVEFNLKLQKAGCYEVGFGSYDFDFRKQDIGGTYKLEYFNDDKLIKEKTVTGQTISGATSFSNTNYINAVIDMDSSIREYTNMRVRLTVIQPFKTKDTFTFYATDTYAKGHCDVQAFINMFQARNTLASLTIDIRETNQTLKPLFDALWEKDTSKIKELIPSQFDANVDMVAHHKPLHYSAYLNDTETMRYLLSVGAFIDPQDIQNNTPLHYAVQGNALDSVKFLMDRGADVDKAKFAEDAPEFNKRYKPILFKAACNGYYDLTAYLLQSPKIDKNERYETHDFFHYFDLRCFDEKKDNLKKTKEAIDSYHYQEGMKRYRQRIANQSMK